MATATKRGAVVATLALTLAAGRSHAAPTTAAQHLARGLERYEAGDYEAAASALAASYRLEPTDDALFAWAQAERLSGDCAAAIPLYRKLLTRSLGDQPARMVRSALAECGASAPEPARLPRAGGDTGAVPDEAVTTVQIDAAPGPTARPSRVPPLVLGGLGAAGLIAGGGFWLSARSEAHKASGVPYPEYLEHRDRAAARQGMAIASGVIGGGLVIAGGIWWLVQQDRPTSTATVTGWTGGGGGGFAVSGRY